MRGMTPLEQARARWVRKRYPDPCEFNPQANRAAFEHEVHGAAAWIVGANGKWRLCESCAALPAFKRLRKRTRIRAKEER